MSETHPADARARRLRTALRRVTDVALLVVEFLLVLAGLQGVAQAAVAAAIVLAPNAGGVRGPAWLMLPDLTRRGAQRLELGPPGQGLVAWLVQPPGKPRGTVVLLHGIRLDKASLGPFAAALADSGLRALLIDLPGHGESSGRFLGYGQSEARRVDAVLAAFEARGAALGPLGVLGYSYGGAVALELAKLRPGVRAVVTVSTFSALRDVVGDYRARYLPAPLSHLPDAWFQVAVDEAAGLSGFNPDSTPAHAAELVQARLLFIHGARDTQVPARHSQRLAQAAGTHGELVLIPDGSHDSLLCDPSRQVRREAVAFFARWLHE